MSLYVCAPFFRGHIPLCICTTYFRAHKLQCVCALLSSVVLCHCVYVHHLLPFAYAPLFVYNFLPFVYAPVCMCITYFRSHTPLCLCTYIPVCMCTTLFRGHMPLCVFTPLTSTSICPCVYVHHSLPCAYAPLLVHHILLFAYASVCICTTYFRPHMPPRVCACPYDGMLSKYPTNNRAGCPTRKWKQTQKPPLLGRPLQVTRELEMSPKQIPRRDY